MNIPADLRLTIRVLDILAGEQLRYKSANGFDSRTEKAAHRVMSEDRIAAWTGAPGVWYVASESRKAWHLVSAPELTCDCEDAEKSRTKAARSGICHHIIVAALCEAGRLEEEAEHEAAVNRWDERAEQEERDRRNDYEDALTVRRAPHAAPDAHWPQDRAELAEALETTEEQIEALFGPAA